MLYEMESGISAIDSMLDTKEKRHIVGGIFISISLFFGGLAITTLTVKEEKKWTER